MATFYLSDISHGWLKHRAAKNNSAMGRWLENHYADLVELKLCIKDSGLEELIAERAVNPFAQTIIERNDAPLPRYRAPILYDGVVWQAMFGSWGRKAHELDISRDCVEALAAWTVRENVVQRRASSPATLAGQALELIGRGWTCEESDHYWTRLDEE